MQRPLLFAFLALLPLSAQEKAADPEAISDNSFLIEEAYNQDPGVVQHIFNWQRYHVRGDWAGTFTQEWPAPTRTHQLSYTLPYLHATASPDGKNGMGDVLLNYRLQVAGGEDKDPFNFSPRFSLILPTGDEKQGRGNGALGYQLALPFSVPLTEQWVTHWNLGGTWTPRAKDADGNRADLAAWYAGGSLIWRVHPRFNVMLEYLYSATDQITGPGTKERQPSAYLNPGVRWAYNFDSGLQIVPGIAYTRGVGPSRGDNAIFLYLSFEHPFMKK